MLTQTYGIEFFRLISLSFPNSVVVSGIRAEGPCLTACPRRGRFRASVRVQLLERGGPPPAGTPPARGGHRVVLPFGTQKDSKKGLWSVFSFPSCIFVLTSSQPAASVRLTPGGGAGVVPALHTGGRRRLRTGQSQPRNIILRLL